MKAWLPLALIKLIGRYISMKDILARIYFVYIGLLFAFTMIWVALAIFIVHLIVSEKKFPAALRKIYAVWMGIYMPLIFCPVRHYGHDKFMKEKNYVVVINHNSFMDIPVSAPGIPVPSKTLAKVELSKVPVFGYIYAKGSILVDRQNRKSRYESFMQMKDALANGLSLCLYPEGTRNVSGDLLGSFKDGAFKTAMAGNVDVLPGIILGTKNILHPTRKMYAWPHQIEIHFLDAIDISKYGAGEVGALREDVRNVMLQFIERNKNKLG